MDEMNSDPSKATLWKGRVLIGVEYAESESPMIAVQKMDTEAPIDPQTEKPSLTEPSIRDVAKKYLMM